MSKKLDQMKPDEVCGRIQQQIRKVAGDEVENKTEVYARNGYYFIFFPLGVGLAAMPHIYRRTRLATLAADMRRSMKSNA